MNTPLADRIRPATLDDVVGQQHILGEGKALRNIMESGRIPNLIFYGPSGVGKTTVARLLAKIYHAIGVLSKGQLVEVDRSGLSAEISKLRREGVLESEKNLFTLY